MTDAIEYYTIGTCQYMAEYGAHTGEEHLVVTCLDNKLVLADSYGECLDMKAVHRATAGLHGAAFRSALEKKLKTLLRAEVEAEIRRHVEGCLDAIESGEVCRECGKGECNCNN